ncbi:MAG: peptide deformylase [Chloroflexi bacterium]|nr:peptide deformylase [Chloroflexota bacterium]MDA1173615.1 peptide deformylase [Chloroflexota bacterium]
MAILPMHYVGHDPILREKAIKVRDFDDPELHKLAADMIESMYYYYGVGLAANQVGSLKRICVIQLPDDEEPTVLINLEITRKEGEREVTEGCLSLPGWQGYIPRAEQVWARAVGLDGKPIKYKGVEDLLAQALEHEADHLDGKLYVDYLRAKEDLFEVDNGAEEHGEGEPRPPGEDGSDTQEEGDSAPAESPEPSLGKE